MHVVDLWKLDLILNRDPDHMIGGHLTVAFHIASDRQVRIHLYYDSYTNRGITIIRGFLKYHRNDTTSCGLLVPSS
ncbi:hypothetical protein AFLA_002479 [Aspergillus flavus NRRL3357]|nr:hypothetical protein AFLA_002479 [Aspergillus flavus NRRL3357]